ncbi:MAG: polysaccharide deacetylase family protein [Bacteroidaceae bacterium]|nr:polysaccharide deacetylase family protein [Bacteroidaceae bacterium]
MLIEQPARFLRWIYPHAVWRMDPSAKAIYLTFDDGPIPEATPYVLDTLAHYGIKATFFVVGDNVRKHPDIFSQVVAAGHRIGNHTYNHIGGLKYLSKNYVKNAEKAQELILDSQSASHYDDKASAAQPAANGELPGMACTKLFRPPHGWMRGLQYKAMRRQGYKIIMWDLVTRDYSTWLTADEVLDNVKHYARNGSIITFHDSLRSIDKLHKILPAALEWLISQGYEFRVFD